MDAITIQLNKNLSDRLKKQAEIEQKSYSELVCYALEEFLCRSEQRHIMEAMIQEMRALPVSAHQEELSIAEEALLLDNEAMDLAEDRNSGDKRSDGNDEKWWI